MPNTPSTWYRQRSYAHFDRPLTKKQAYKLVTNKDKVARHPFLPLISETIKNVYKEADHKGRRRFKKKKRPIAFAGHADSHIFAYYALQLSQLLETHYQKHPCVGQAVLAYRKYPANAPNTNIHFAYNAFEEIQIRGNCEVIALDIEGFFDNLDHQLLKQNWAALLSKERLPPCHYAIFRATTKSTTIHRKKLQNILGGEVRRRRGKQNGIICPIDKFRTEIAPHLEPTQHIVARTKGQPDPDLDKGIPQGLPISAVLANLYMLNIDKEMVRAMQELGGSYRRYSDDILLVAPTGKGIKAENKLSQAIKQVKLRLQANKTQRVLFQQSNQRQYAWGLNETYENHNNPTHLAYLGFRYDGKQILLRDGTISKFKMKAVRTINQSKRTAIKNKHPLKKRKLLTKLTTLGYGQAYGTIIYCPKNSCTINYSIIPRLGFFAYAQRALKITASEPMAKQIRQIENEVFRLINQAEKEVQDKLRKQS